MYACDARDCIEWLRWLRQCWTLLKDMPTKKEGDYCVIDVGILPPKLENETQEDYNEFCFQQRCVAFFSQTGHIDFVTFKERCGRAIHDGEILGLVDGQLDELQYIYETAWVYLCDNLDVVYDVNLEPDLASRIDTLIAWLEESL